KSGRRSTRYSTAPLGATRVNEETLLRRGRVIAHTPPQCDVCAVYVLTETLSTCGTELKFRPNPSDRHSIYRCRQGSLILNAKSLSRSMRQARRLSHERK